MNINILDLEFTIELVIEHRGYYFGCMSHGSMYSCSCTLHITSGPELVVFLIQSVQSVVSQSPPCSLVWRQYQKWILTNILPPTVEMRPCGMLTRAHLQHPEKAYALHQRGP